MTEAANQNKNFALPEESVRSIYVGMVNKEHGNPESVKVIATGTGFFYRSQGNDFFVTARHNVTGWDTAADAWLDGCGQYNRPTDIRIGLWAKEPEGGYPITKELSTHLQILLYEIPLYSDEDRLTPCWLEHPKHGADVDVVALPVPTSRKASYEDNCMYLPWSIDSGDTAGFDTKVWVTQDVYITGYPYGVNSNNTPIWMRGTIASEPQVLYRAPAKNFFINDEEEGEIRNLEHSEALPLILVDARTRRGMSGAPVLFFRPPGTIVTVDHPFPIGITRGTQSKLIGIYSGRINKDSDLGFVWRSTAVDEICKSGVPGSI